MSAGHLSHPARLSLVTSLWTISYSLAAEVHQNIKQPPEKGNHFWDFSLYIVMHHTKGIGQNVLKWRSFIVVLCLWNLAPGYYTRHSLVWVILFHLWGKQCTFLGWRRLKTDWLRGLWRDASACAEQMVAQLVLNTEKEHSYLLSSLGLSAGMRKISVWEMAFGYRAHHQQYVNIFDGIFQLSLKGANRGSGGGAHCLDPTSPPWLINNEQSL